MRSRESLTTLCLRAFHAACRRARFLPGSCVELDLAPRRRRTRLRPPVLACSKRPLRNSTCRLRLFTGYYTERQRPLPPSPPPDTGPLAAASSAASSAATGYVGIRANRPAGLAELSWWGKLY
ncbi:hypothetical protein NHJ6243_003309 [Beauveria neobassiana]